MTKTAEWPYWPAILARACTLDLPAPKADDRRASASGQPRRAAVLIGITDEAVPGIYFTQRSEALTHHPGQISFPGGRIEPTDTSPGAAALREAHEEIGLAPGDVSILGGLPEYRTVTGFAIAPIVGWVSPPRPCRADGREVVRVFSVPLSVALDAEAYRFRRIERDGVFRRIYSLDHQGDHIWGATAAMLADLARRVARAQDRPFSIDRADAG